MRLIGSLMLACATLPVSGCWKPDPAPTLPSGPDFCVVEEPRRFTQEEVDWRAEHAPANFRRDLKTNATGKAECGWTGAAG